MARAISASIQPPKYPAMMPKNTPMTTASTVARKPISREYCDPTTTLASMSLPVTGSTPRGCARLMPPHGPFGRLNVGLIRFELYVSGFCTTCGPMIATRTRKTMKIPPAIATRSLRSRRQAI